jgi:hypothetical protein
VGAGVFAPCIGLMVSPLGTNVGRKKGGCIGKQRGQRKIKKTFPGVGFWVSGRRVSICVSNIHSIWLVVAGRH